MQKFTLACAMVALGLASVAHAGPLTLDFGAGVTGSSSSFAAGCFNPDTVVLYSDCRTAGFLSSNLATNSDLFMNLDTFGGGGQAAGNETFASAFQNSLGSGWTLAQGNLSDLQGITMTVTNFRTGSYGNVGGIGGMSADNITVILSGLSDLNNNLANELVWIQGLEINYKPGTNYSTATNYNVLDDVTFDGLASGCHPIPSGSPATVPGNPFPSATKYCDPVYPYQYGDRTFYDAPLGPWPNGSFRGIALLATIDAGAHTVTTYAGVSYGFDNYIAPEPGTWALLLAGVSGIFLGRRRRMARG